MPILALPWDQNLKNTAWFRVRLPKEELLNSMATEKKENVFRMKDEDLVIGWGGTPSKLGDVFGQECNSGMGPDSRSSESKGQKKGLLEK
ncbi:hypothetical protein NPIL_508981 [Nephila pilipes]|uniref:Uncharacterized protein n=1 Tax=Nephila pilipes TaxID=299642 RepID=A0A8X6IJS6_NEPPI|nr:hypothetical protein NPIL_508981 [Nephila pilipes]